MLEPLADDMLVDANTGGGIGHPWPSFGEPQEFGDRDDAERLMNGEHDRLARDLDDRSQVLDWIEVQLEGVRRTRHAIGSDEECIAIGCALRDGVHTCGAARAGSIVNDEL